VTYTDVTSNGSLTQLWKIVKFGRRKRFDWYGAIGDQRRGGYAGKRPGDK